MPAGKAKTTIDAAAAAWLDKMTGPTTPRIWVDGVDTAIGDNNYAKGVASFLGVGTEDIGIVNDGWKKALSGKSADYFKDKCRDKSAIYSARLKARLTRKGKDTIRTV